MLNYFKADKINIASFGNYVPHVHFHLIPSSIHQLGRHAAQIGDQAKIQALAEKIKAAL